MIIINTKNITFLYLLLLTVNVYGASSSTTSSSSNILKTTDDKKNEIIFILPWPYKILDDATKATCQYVPQQFYTIIGKNRIPQTALVFPLNPCLLVGIRDNTNDQSLIFHVPVYCNPNNIKKIIKEKIKNNSNLTGIIFGIEDSTSPQQSKIFTDLEKTLNKLCTKGLTTKLYETFPVQTHYLFNMDALTSVAIDKDLNVISLSPLASGLFLSELPPSPEKQYSITEECNNALLYKALKKYKKATSSENFSELNETVLHAQEIRKICENRHEVPPQFLKST